jgi:hypothetical protein
MRGIRGWILGFCEYPTLPALCIGLTTYLSFWCCGGEGEGGLLSLLTDVAQTLSVEDEVLWFEEIDV